MAELKRPYAPGYLRHYIQSGKSLEVFMKARMRADILKDDWGIPLEAASWCVFLAHSIFSGNGISQQRAWYKLSTMYPVAVPLLNLMLKDLDIVPIAAFNKVDSDELPTDVKLTGNNPDTIITDEVHKMSQNIKKVIILNDHAIKTVQVAHSEAELESGKGYTYLVRADLAAELKEGDVVLLEPKNKRPSSGYVIAVDEVQQVAINTAFDYKWVVQKFDPAPVEECKAALKEGVKRVENAARIDMKVALRREIGCSVKVL